MVEAPLMSVDRCQPGPRSADGDSDEMTGFGHSGNVGHSGLESGSGPCRSSFLALFLLPSPRTAVGCLPPFFHQTGFLSVLPLVLLPPALGIVRDSDVNGLPVLHHAVLGSVTLLAQWLSPFLAQFAGCSLLVVAAAHPRSDSLPFSSPRVDGRKWSSTCLPPR